MEDEITTLRAEVAELRSACLKMFTLIAATLPGQPSSAAALHTMLANVRAMQPPGEATLLDEWTTSALRAVSSVAVKQHPQDQDVLAVYRGLRPGQRH
jgi:hypothetical protein